MPRVLGVDPGSRITGFGVVDTLGAGIGYVASGSIRTGSAELPQRLREIFEQLSGVLDTYRPEVLAIEQVFVNRNVDSALKLGQARGAAICACAVRDLPVAEYAPRAIKLALVGAGAASKEQVQFMVRSVLRLDGRLQADAADALAVAICHCHHRVLTQRLGQALPGGRR